MNAALAEIIPTFTFCSGQASFFDLFQQNAMAKLGTGVKGSRYRKFAILRSLENKQESTLSVQNARYIHPFGYQLFQSKPRYSFKQTAHYWNPRVIIFSHGKCIGQSCFGNSRNSNRRPFSFSASLENFA